MEKQNSALRGPSSLRGRDSRVVVIFGVADLACNLGTGACAHKRAREPFSALAKLAEEQIADQERGTIDD
jgi:hypothetical protein